MLQVVGPILGIVGAAIILGFVVPVLLDRRRGPIPPGTPRKYGLSGGTICSRCGRPYPLHLFSINISFTGRLDRCPHCGKWALVQRRGLAELRRAEQEELEAAGETAQITGETEAEKLRKELDDSRFQGM
jgi:DNA-directed RNA polymerase subunit RPC12/RpoP